jgi:hypothetical protein
VNWLRLVAVMAIASISVAVVGWVVPARAVAALADDPHPLAVSLFCRFVPIAPALDGDVDLTKQVPPADPAAPAPDSLPPVDICASGCVQQNRPHEKHDLSGMTRGHRYSG